MFSSFGQLWTISRYSFSEFFFLFFFFFWFLNFFFIPNTLFSHFWDSLFQSFSQHTLIGQVTPVVAHVHVNAALGRKFDHPPRRLQVVGGHPDVPHLSGSLQLGQGGEGVIDQLVEGVHKVKVVDVQDVDVVHAESLQTLFEWFESGRSVVIKPVCDYTIELSVTPDLGAEVIGCSGHSFKCLADKGFWSMKQTKSYFKVSPDERTLEAHLVLPYHGAVSTTFTPDFRAVWSISFASSNSTLSL